MTQDLVTIAGITVAVVPLTAIAVWLYFKWAARKLPPVGLILLGLCLELYFVKQPYIQLGLQIYPNDVISILVLLATLAGFAYRRLPVTDRLFLLWLAFGTTIIMSLIVGLYEYGRYAGTEVRPFFYIWVAGLYCCTTEFEEADLTRIARWCVWTAYAVMAIALYYWVGVEAGFVNRRATFGGGLEAAAFRPVGAQGALFVAAVGLVQTMAWLRGSGTRFAGWHAGLFLAFAVIIQHRTVWVAAAFGLLCVLVLERRHLPRRFALLLAFTLTATFTIAAAFAFGMLDDLGMQLMKSTTSMFDKGGTFAARVDGWDRLFDEWWSESPLTLLFGFPFGRGYTRVYNGEIIQFAPHNFYIDLLLRVGIVGMILFLLSTLIPIVQGLRAKPASEFEYLLRRGLAVVLLSALLYFIAYPSNYVIGAATGIALARQVRSRQFDSAGRSALRPVRSPLTWEGGGWRTGR